MSKANVLLSSARSGTNYFLSVYKECFPNDFVVKEIFRRKGDSFAALEGLLQMSQEDILAFKQISTCKFWERVEARCVQESRGCMAKIFYYHFPRDEELWNHIRTKNRVTHLIRRNAFDVFLSTKIAVETGHWQETGKNKSRSEVGPFTLDPDEISAFLDKQRDHVATARAFFAQSDYSEVFYEDIASSIDACTAQITEIFGPFETKPPTKVGIVKQKKKSNRELVANYDEIAHLDVEIF